ncbi:MAG TPA: hypothetical protein VLA83_14480 [Candidatus Binatia bacterium]|nr:hypothetical protein [Candidatus Binatia bacterium]
MKVIHYILLTVGLLWLSFASWIMVSNVILRETPLGVFAKYLDMLPAWIGHPVHIILWLILLLGWSVALVIALRPLFIVRNRRKPA